MDYDGEVNWSKSIKLYAVPGCAAKQHVCVCEVFRDVWHNTLHNTRCKSLVVKLVTADLFWQCHNGHTIIELHSINHELLVLNNFMFLKIVAFCRIRNDKNFYTLEKIFVRLIASISVVILQNYQSSFNHYCIIIRINALSGA